jgi:hypothetical protein
VPDVIVASASTRVSSEHQTAVETQCHAIGHILSRPSALLLCARLLDLDGDFQGLYGTATAKARDGAA